MGYFWGNRIPRQPLLSADGLLKLHVQEPSMKTVVIVCLYRNNPGFVFRGFFFFLEKIEKCLKQVYKLLKKIEWVSNSPIHDEMLLFMDIVSIFMCYGIDWCHLFDNFTEIDRIHGIHWGVVINKANVSDLLFTWVNDSSQVKKWLDNFVLPIFINFVLSAMLIDQWPTKRDSIVWITVI